MKPGSLDTEGLLAEARRSVHPDPEARARSREALSAVLGRELFDSAAASEQPEARVATRPEDAMRARREPTVVGKPRLFPLVLGPRGAIGLGSVLLAAGFIAGYGLASRAPQLGERLAAPGVTVPADPSQVQKGPPPGVSVSQPAARREDVVTPGDLEPQAVGGDAPAPVTERTAPSESARPSKAVPARRAVKPPVARLTLRDVLERLERAREAIEGGRASLAILLLSELDRGAGDVLREEREVTRILALCALGERERARAVARSVAAPAESIYVRRIEGSCVGELE